MQHGIVSLITVSARYNKITPLILTRETFYGKTLVFSRPIGFFTIHTIAADILIALHT
jgi:hypothetical protein